MYDTRFTKQIRNVMKVLGVAIAVYLALTIKIWLTGESDEVAQFDYLESETQEVINEEVLDPDEHGAGSTFSKLCNKYPTICKKLTRSWKFEDSDKTIKFAYVVYLLQILDDNIKRGENPSDALKAMLINQWKGSRRGSANRDTITLNLWNMDYESEFFQVISHEIWHIVDLWWLKWTSSKKSSIYTEFNKEVFAIDDPSLEFYKYSRSSEKVRKSWMTKEDFCSGYGMTDPFEDFAECHNLYLNHHDYFQKIALTNSTVKNKYNYLSNLYWWNFINESEASYENRTEPYRARDTTKLREG